MPKSKQVKSQDDFKRHTFVKKTSIAGNDAAVKTSSMNKSRRQSYKKYRGQGR